MKMCRSHHEITSGAKVNIMSSEFWLKLQLPSHIAAQHRRNPHLPSVGWHYEEGFDVVFLEEGVPFLTVPRLHLVISVQALQRGSGDVDLPVGRKGETERRLAGEVTKPFIKSLPQGHRSFTLSVGGSSTRTEQRFILNY